MKSTLVLLAVSSLTICATAHAVAVPVAQEQMGDYKKAVTLAIHDGTFTCTQLSGTSEGSVEQRINEAGFATLDSDGVQPLLVFTVVKDDGCQKVVTITTSVDYKTITNIRTEDFVKTEVNSGDLRHPYFTTGYRSTGAFECHNTAVQQ